MLRLPRVPYKTIQELQTFHDQQLLRNVKLVVRSREYKVKSFRLPEARQATDKEDTEEVLRSFPVNNLKMVKEMVEEISFERVHGKYADKTSTRDIQRFEANNCKVLFLPTKTSRSAGT